MENINKGDTVQHITTRLNYVVDSIENYDGIIVIFTEGSICKCIPINEVKKIKSHTLSDYFLKLFKGEKLTDDEDFELTNKLKPLKLVTILPLDPNSLKL